MPRWLCCTVRGCCTQRSRSMIPGIARCNQKARTRHCSSTAPFRFDRLSRPHCCCTPSKACFQGTHLCNLVRIEMPLGRHSMRRIGRRCLRSEDHKMMACRRIGQTRHRTHRARCSSSHCFPMDTVVSTSARRTYHDTNRTLRHSNTPS